MEFQKFLVIFLNTKLKYFSKTQKFTSKIHSNIQTHPQNIKSLYQNQLMYTNTRRNLYPKFSPFIIKHTIKTHFNINI